jgi:hypothetical protein
VIYPAWQKSAKYPELTPIFPRSPFDPFWRNSNCSKRPLQLHLRLTSIRIHDQTNLRFRCSREPAILPAIHQSEHRSRQHGETDSGAGVTGRDRRSRSHRQQQQLNRAESTLPLIAANINRFSRCSGRHRTNEETKPIFIAATEKYLASAEQNGQVLTHGGNKVWPRHSHAKSRSTSEFLKIREAPGDSPRILRPVALAVSRHSFGFK